MKPTKIASPNQPTARPQGIPAIVRAAPTGISQTHAAEIAGVPAPKHRRMNQLEDYIARIRQAATVGSVSKGGQPEGLSAATATTSNIDDLPTNSQGVNPDQQTRTEVASGVSDGPVFRTDAAHRSIDQALGNVPTPHLDAAALAQAAEDHECRARLIREISTAIASALTDVPADVLAGKLKQGIESTPAEAIVANTVSQPLPVEVLDQEVSPVPEAEVPIAEVAQPSPANDQAFREIAPTVAAWDVEDFRWPVLSNQMIATAGDAMQDLFENIAAVVGDDRLNRLAVTGAGRGEGASTIAISLARWAAATGKSVLLIDADLASPNLTNQIGLEHGLSWMTSLERMDNPAEVIIRAQRSNLCVMPLAPIVDRSGYSRCIYDSLGPFLSRVEQHFDWIILDMGPGSQVLAELSRPELLIDTALLVNSSQDMTVVQSLQDRLQAMGLTRFVVAQNSVRQQAAA